MHARQIAFVRSVATVFASAMIWMLLTQSAQAQTFAVLHNFTGAADGASPMAGVTLDRAGNLYGTASAGGLGYGAAFKLAHSGSGWTFNSLYQFQGGADGAIPMAALVFGPDGSLYGTTQIGGNNTCTYVGGETGCGTVFNLKPSPTRSKTVLSPWLESVIYRFTFWTDGAQPLSEVIFDPAGNLYGTTFGGGENDAHDGPPGGGGCSYHCGVVYELSPSKGSWTESTLFQFSEDSGANPFAGLIFDAAGNLYGITANEGAEGLGAAFKMTPSGSGWTENTLHNFQWAEGASCLATPMMDAAGNLYAGNQGYSGYYGKYDGNAFRIGPDGDFFSLYAFAPDDGPYAGLTMDAAGNIYGTTPIGGANNYGSVFELTPSGGGWNYTSLHDFSGLDGCRPQGKVVIDAKGNLYGTASLCGTNGFGTIWEITP